MQTSAVERRQAGRGRRVDSGQGHAGPRGSNPRARRSSGEEMERLKEVRNVTQKKDRRKERGEEGDKRGREHSRHDGERSRRAVSEGGEVGEETVRMRWRVHQLEKERVELTSSHNQELCTMQAELTRLRSSVERGEAQRAELQYQLSISQRDAERAAELSRDKHMLTEQAARLQQTVQELRKVVDMTRKAREEDQHALQQEVEERDTLIQNFISENQRLHQLLQEQEAALEVLKNRIEELQKEREKEADVKQQLTNDLKHLSDEEKRRKTEKEVSDQKIKCLQVNVEAERAAHLETKFACELVQLQVRDLEAALTAERSGQQEAQRDVELLRAQLNEAERAYSLERERSSSTGHALKRLQMEFEQCKTDLSVALETERKKICDLTRKLEDELGRHADTQTLLEQRQSDTDEAFANIREIIIQHDLRGSSPSAKHDGNWSPAEVLHLLKMTLSTCRHRLDTADKEIQNQLRTVAKLGEENQTLCQLTSEQLRQMEESQQEVIKLQQQVTNISQEVSDWSVRSSGLQAELEREREERKAEVHELTEHFQGESKVRLAFLHCVYQRLLAGCVLLHQPQSMLGNFTWKELCGVISEQVDQLNSDLKNAKEKIAQLQSVCEKKSVCILQLQRSQECVLSRLEESMKRREEAWSKGHTHAVAQLQACRSEHASVRDQVSSLQLRLSSLTSDLQKRRREASSFLSAAALLAGALRHAHHSLGALCQQKMLLAKQLAEKELLEEDMRRLAAALSGDNKEEEAGRKAVRRWRGTVWAVLALRRWHEMARRTTLLFRVEVEGSGAALGVCRVSTKEARKGQISDSTDDSESNRCQAACARWLHSKSLSSTILTSVADLQEVLTRAGSTPTDVMSACHSALSRLVKHLFNQSDTSSSLSHHRLDEEAPRKNLMSRQPPKNLVSALQQHFLIFSQRLHSAEVERRSLRLEVANLKKGLRHEGEETVPAERFHSVCSELRQALSREQEAQELLQEKTSQLHSVQQRVNTHAAEQGDTQNTLSRTVQALSEARQEVSRKERSLSILGKHLSAIQRERKQLEERLETVEKELRAAAKCRDSLISGMKAAEMSCNQVRERLVQSFGTLSHRTRPLLLPRQHLVMSGAESITGAPELAACQDLLSSFSQLYHSCCSTIDWLEQEVSTHRSHVIALRSELEDICLRDNLASVPKFPENFPSTDVETLHPYLHSDFSRHPSVSISSAPALLNPTHHKQGSTPSLPCSKPPKAKTKEKRSQQKSRKGTRQTDRK